MRFIKYWSSYYKSNNILGIFFKYFFNSFQLNLSILDNGKSDLQHFAAYLSGIILCNLLYIVMMS